MGKTFTGSTEEAIAPILGAKFWTKDTRIEGIVLGSFDTRNGKCFSIKLNKSLDVSGDLISPRTPGQQKLDTVSIGSLTGFEMALRAAMGAEQLLAGDNIIVICTGESDTGQESKMVHFKVRVIRPDKATEQKAEAAF